MHINAINDMSKVDVLALMLKTLNQWWVMLNSNFPTKAPIKTKALKINLLEIYEIKPLKHRKCSRSKGIQRLKEKKLKAHLSELGFEEEKTWEKNLLG